MKSIKINGIDLPSPKIQYDGIYQLNFFVIDSFYMKSINDQAKKDAVLRIKYGDVIEIENDIGAKRKTIVKDVEFNENNLKVYFRM